MRTLVAYSGELAAQINNWFDTKVRGCLALPYIIK